MVPDQFCETDLRKRQLYTTYLPMENILWNNFYTNFVFQNWTRFKYSPNQLKEGKNRHTVTFSEKQDGTIIVWLNTRKQTGGFPADKSALAPLFWRSYDMIVITLSRDFLTTNHGDVFR